MTVPTGIESDPGKRLSSRGTAGGRRTAKPEGIKDMFDEWWSGIFEKRGEGTGGGLGAADGDYLLEYDPKTGMPLYPERLSFGSDPFGIKYSDVLGRYNAELDRWNVLDQRKYDAPENWFGEDGLYSKAGLNPNLAYGQFNPQSGGRMEGSQGPGRNIKGEFAREVLQTVLGSAMTIARVRNLNSVSLLNAIRGITEGKRQGLTDKMMEKLGLDIQLQQGTLQADIRAATLKNVGQNVMNMHNLQLYKNSQIDQIIKQKEYEIRNIQKVQESYKTGTEYWKSVNEKTNQIKLLREIKALDKNIDYQNMINTLMRGGLSIYDNPFTRAAYLVMIDPTNNYAKKAMKLSGGVGLAQAAGGLGAAIGLKGIFKGRRIGKTNPIGFNY